MHLCLSVIISILFAGIGLSTGKITFGNFNTPSKLPPLAIDSTGTRSHQYKLVMKDIRGGKVPSSSSSADTKWSLRKSIWKNVLGLWGVMQVLSVLANAVKRLYPIAIQPIIQKDMLPFQWGLYVMWSLYMGYTEGYKAFQLKFSPLVVQRAFALIENPSILNYVLAGPYSMGLFGASRKRMIVGWSVTAGVFAIVKVVKMLPYPYRSIVDAGVVVGLTYGSLSICALTVKALLGGKVEAPEESGGSGSVKEEQKKQ